MEPESQWESLESLQSLTAGQAQCLLCRRIYLADNGTNDRLEDICVCGECKATFLQDLETTVRVSQRRRPRRGRSRFRSSESIDDPFSQEFSNLINLVRQNQHSITVSVTDQYEQEGQHYDAAPTVFPRSSSHTPQSRSRRSWRAVSDNDSESFDNMESLFGENDSMVSFSYRGALPGDSDAISISAYGGDSDASVDGRRNPHHRGLFIQQGDGSFYNSETDIDPMHAGLDQWYSDDQDEDVGWEEADIEDGQTQDEYSRHNMHIEVNSARDGDRTNWRILQARQNYVTNHFAGSEQSEIPPSVSNAGDFFDARGLEVLLEQLVETDGSRQGAPPAAVSFVGNLPRIIIHAEDVIKYDGLVCAVCKDPLAVNTEVNQLPCSHLYHPDCILPWLSTRNSCPVCRHEFPTDDRDYEGKRSAVPRTEYLEIRRQESSEDSSSDNLGDDEAEEVQIFTRGRMEGNSTIGNHTFEGSNREGRRGGWLVFAAAPIVSIVGLVLVLWLRDPHFRERFYFRVGGENLGTRSISSVSSSRSEQRGRRRWWSLFSW